MVPHPEKHSLAQAIKQNQEFLRLKNLKEKLASPIEIEPLVRNGPLRRTQEKEKAPYTTSTTSRNGMHWNWLKPH